MEVIQVDLNRIAELKFYGLLSPFRRRKLYLLLKLLMETTLDVPCTIALSSVYGVQGTQEFTIQILSCLVRSA